VDDTTDNIYAAFDVGVLRCYACDMILWMR